MILINQTQTIEQKEQKEYIESYLQILETHRSQLKEIREELFSLYEKRERTWRKYLLISDEIYLVTKDFASPNTKLNAYGKVLLKLSSQIKETENLKKSTNEYCNILSVNIENIIKQSKFLLSREERNIYLDKLKMLSSRTVALSSISLEKNVSLSKTKEVRTYEVPEEERAAKYERIKFISTVVNDYYPGKEDELYYSEAMVPEGEYKDQYRTEVVLMEEKVMSVSEPVRPSSPMPFQDDGENEDELLDRSNTSTPTPVFEQQEESSNSAATFEQYTYSQGSSSTMFTTPKALPPARQSAYFTPISTAKRL